MTTEEYENLDSCPACGHGFAGYGYAAVTFLGIAFTGIAWLIHWKESTKVNLVGATAMTCMGIGFATLIVTIDQVLLRTTHLDRRVRRRIGAWLTVGILIAIAFLTKDYVIGLTK
jgi:hypothetical protein